MEDQEQDHNAELHRTEPEHYHIVSAGALRTVTLGDREYTVGICTNTKKAWGYCDHEMIWVADSITDLNDFIRTAIHEGLHGMFPKWTEAEVGRSANELGDLIKALVLAKGATLPELEPMTKSMLTVDRVLPSMREWFETHMK